jgi:hypothetical protein
MNTDQTPRNVLVATLLTVLGSLLALLPAAGLVGIAEFCVFVDLSDYPIPTPGTHYLRISLPALLVFGAVSRTFPRWPALWTNTLFAAFIVWRAATHGQVVFTWTLGWAIALIVGVALSCPKTPRSTFLIPPS